MFNHLKSVCDSFYRKLVLAKLGSMRGGRLAVRENGRTFLAGDRGELSAAIEVLNPRMYRRAAWAGGLGLAESLMDGDWQCDDLTSLVRIFIRNLEVSDKFNRRTGWLSAFVSRFRHALRHNSRNNARRNIREHYDLSNDFYSLFLDETMSYSSGIFLHPDNSMAQASREKIGRACRKLQLGPDDHLLEIGTGWGGLAVYAAENFGCRVTTTTISDEQYRFAKRRVRDAGLERQVNVMRQDYRDLRGRYDKLVSIEMIEAVGHHYYPAFFQKCGELLRAEGAMLLQAIVIRDDRYVQHLRNVDFIRRFIFPGGSLPSVSAITQHAAGDADMRPVHLEDFAPHYAETLRRWRSEFNAKLDAVRELGFSESFIRMWDYYFAYCEGAFEERQVNVVQMLLGKRRCQLDSASMHMAEFTRERDLGKSAVIA